MSNEKIIQYIKMFSNSCDAFEQKATQLTDASEANLPADEMEKLSNEVCEYAKILSAECTIYLGHFTDAEKEFSDDPEKLNSIKIIITKINITKKVADNYIQMLSSIMKF